ncbi:MAG: Meiotic Sister-Chromatid recombination aldehyde dehydrogenase [Candelina mexicana]|nr:MAG: Meiotic Sister-Chromatid recombination aldehyde dehydrogenase [Candelina mexicana]
MNSLTAYLSTATESVPLSLVFVLITTIFLLIVLSSSSQVEDEGAIGYTLPILEQYKPGWKGEVLDEPMLKIPGSSIVQCYCPASGQLLGIVNPATPDGIDRAIAKAKEAQIDWAGTSFAQRRRVLRTLLKFILDNQESIATAACLDSGKTRVDASFGEILVTAEKLKWTIDHGEKALATERRPTNFLMMYKVNEVRWEPLGVVAACVSWNYPFHNLLGPIISAMFAGNGIIVKSSESTAWSSIYFTNIVQSALSACGHSPNLVQTLTCWPTTASHLTSHHGISHLTFIGSRPVAHLVCASAAKSLTPICVELGGKDAAIVLDDISDIEKVASILMRGVFQSAGQNCVGIERVIALPKIYPRLVKLLEPRIRSLRVGNTLDDQEEVDVGAMISATNFPKLESLIAEAVSQGARLLIGGQQYAHPKYPKGHYFQPTLLADVTSSMRIAQEEVFAPIFVLMRASDVDDAIRIANSTEYGLGASVFGTSKRDLEKVVKCLKVGMIAVNDFAAFYAVQLPFGGVKGSGYGRFAGYEGLRSLCNPKSVCRDRVPWLASTRIPRPLDYPIGSARRAWEVCCGIVELGYGESWRRRGKGLLKVLIGG